MTLIEKRRNVLDENVPLDLVDSCHFGFFDHTRTIQEGQTKCAYNSKIYSHHFEEDICIDSEKGRAVTPG